MEFFCLKALWPACLGWSCLVWTVSSQAPTTLPPTTTTDDGDFFDDDNNKAMYLVLPAMVLVYGGCAFIYCAHRLRRYCKGKAKARAKEEKKKAKQKERVTFSNPLVSSDSGQAGARRRGDDVEQQKNSQQAAASSQRPATSMGMGEAGMQLESLEHDDEDQLLILKRGRSRSAGFRTQETDVDAIEDVLETDNSKHMGAVAPGYTDSDLSKEMMHLDNQLKAAFRLTQDTSKVAAPETAEDNPAGAAPPKFKTPMDYKSIDKNLNSNETNSDKFGSKADAIDGRTSADGGLAAASVKQTPTAPPAAAAGMPDEQVPATNTTVVVASDRTQQDLESMMSIRKKINKGKEPEPPPGNVRGKPDIRPIPEENAIAIKRVHIKALGNKRKFFLSSQ